MSISFAETPLPVSSMRKVRRSLADSSPADVEGDLADRRGGDGILDQQYQRAPQGFTVAIALLAGRQRVIDKQLQTLALHRRQHLRYDVVDQLLHREQRLAGFPCIAFQQVGELNIIDQFDQLIGMLRQRPALRAVERRCLSRR